MVEYPEYKDQLYDEIKKEFSEEITYEKLTENAFLDSFIQESLRLGQSILAMDKVAAKDVVLEKGNIKLDKGTTIFLITYLNNVDEKYFPEPEKFIPTRFIDKSSNNPNNIQMALPFSAGNRMCVGNRFAMLTMKYLVVKVLLHYDLYKPSNYKVEEISRRRFCIIKKELLVGFKKRKLGSN